MGTILVATREEEREFLEMALGKTHSLRWCTTWRQAELAMDADLDAVLCSVHFDDGRLFDMMEMVRSGSATKAVPAYGIVVHARHSSLHFIQSLRSAVSLFDGQGVLDLAGLRRECGDVEASAMLRTAIDGIVTTGMRKRHRAKSQDALKVAA